MVQGKASRRLRDLGAVRVGGRDLWLGPKPPASLALEACQASEAGQRSTFVPAIDEAAVEFPVRNGPGVWGW